MKRTYGYLDRLALKAELPGEVMPGQTLVEIIGDARVLIEFHKGVVCYGCDKIVVRTFQGYLCIYGSGMHISCMTAQQLVVSGHIHTVSVEKGC